MSGIHPKLGTAAFAIAVVTTIVAWLQFLAHVTVPAEVIAPTDVVVGAIVGYFTPSS